MVSKCAAFVKKPLNIDEVGYYCYYDYTGVQNWLEKFLFLNNSKKCKGQEAN